MLIPLFEISGTPYAMGFELGAKARRFIRAGLAFNKKHWRAMNHFSWAQSEKLLRHSCALAGRLIPKTYDELRGMADGSGTTVNDLFVLNSGEVLTAFQKQKKQRTHCTSILLRRGNHILHAHNEDWMAADKKWIYLIRAKPAGEPSFLAFTYGAWGINYGVNSAGLAYTADSQTATDTRRTGLSQTLVGREILRSHSIREATRRVLALPRADGHSYVVSSATGEGIVLETTPTAHAEIKVQPTGFLVHTNVYQTPQTARFEHSSRANSRFRLYRVHELLDGKKIITERDIVRALSDHKNYPESICNHAATINGKPADDETIASLVIDPIKQSITLHKGNPCMGKSELFRLT